MFLIANAPLKISVWDIAGTPLGVPYPGAWNGSLWTLYYEFICYLIIGALGFLAVARRSPWFIGGLFVVSVAAQALHRPCSPTWATAMPPC